MTRRRLLARAVRIGAPAVLLGPSVAVASADCADPFAGGVLLGTVPFTGEGGPLGVPFGSGLNGRLYTDLSTLAPTDLVTSNARYFIRTRYPDLLSPAAPWSIAVDGHVKAPVSLTLDMLAPKVIPTLGPYVMECSGNGAFAAFGMLSAARWSGVLLTDVLAMVAVLPRATRVLVSGFDSYSRPQGGISTPGASWVFSIAELEGAGAFLATGMNGMPLSLDHGYPIRLMVPNWYGCACIKWVDAIRLVDDGEPATLQMQEFASRTHQDGVPALARDYRPATIEHGAMPVRVERWRVAGETVYRIVGVMWGGSRVTDKLSIRFASDQPSVPVDVCPAPRSNSMWTLWSHSWRPGVPGVYTIALTIDDPAIPARRLAAGFYARRVRITEV